MLLPAPTNRLLFFALTALSCSAQLLAAQSPADRTALDNILDQLDSSHEITAPDCNQVSKSAARLCGALFLLRRAEMSLDANDVDQARTQFNRIVDEEPKWALGWFGLGRTRMAAAHAGMVSREGALQFAGTPNTIGAAAAFERALDLDPHYALAGDAIAWAPVPFTNKKAIVARVTLLRKYRRALSSHALIGDALFELDAGSPDTAVTLLLTALRTASEETPRGFAQLTLARAYYRIGKSKEGRAALLTGAVETDSAGLEEYRQQISWVGDSTEMREWDTLPPSARERWLKLFWSKRDVLEGRMDGDRLKEHYRRVNYAYANFRYVLPFTGMQKALYIPGEAEMQQTLHSQANMEKNPEYKTALMDWAAARVTLGAGSPFRVFESHQRILDDRGLVYIRHGQPDVRGEWTSPGRNMKTWEVWRYDRSKPQSPLTLYFINIPFEGSVGANTLVPTLQSETPQTREKLSVFDPSLCPCSAFDLRNAIIDGEMGTIRVAESRRAGLAAIKDAVTSDNFPIPTTRAVHPSIETHILDQGQGGAPRLVVAFALPGNELRRDTTRSGFQYSILVTAMAVRTSDGQRVDISGSRHLTATHELGKGEYFSGLLELPMPPGKWLASVVITQADRRGTKIILSEMNVPELTARLSISDLVLGRETSGVKWNSGPGGQQVPLNPLNAFPLGEAASLYAQISGLRPGDEYQVNVELFEGYEASGRPAINIQIPQLARASRAELTQTLGLTNLKAGKYLVRLTVKRGAESVVTTRGMEIR